VGSYTKAELLQILQDWRDLDEPLVEAIGETLAKYERVDSQEMGAASSTRSFDVLGHQLP
jgi:hypothetical protein